MIGKNLRGIEGQQFIQGQLRNFWEGQGSRAKTLQLISETRLRSHPIKGRHIQAVLSVLHWNADVLGYGELRRRFCEKSSDDDNAGDDASGHMNSDAGQHNHQNNTPPLFLTNNLWIGCDYGSHYSS